MKIDKYLQASSNVFEENKILKFGFSVLLILTLINWYSIEDIRKEEKIIIVPPGATGDLWITSEEVSDDYIISMARYILKMTGDYTVNTARSQFNDLLRLFMSSHYGKAKNNFDLLAEDIEKFRSAAQHIEFNEKDIQHDRANKQIKTPVTRLRYINGVNSGSETSTVMIEYSIDAGKFFIKQILEVKNHEK